MVTAPYEANNRLLYLPMSSYVSASGMELWPLYNSSTSTSQRISLELTEFCTHCSASEGYELCEDSCHRKSKALNITQTAYMQHVPTSIPTPFSSDFIQTAFIDSIYTELESIRTPLQNISHKKTGIRHKFDIHNQRANETHPGISLKPKIDTPVAMATVAASSFALAHGHLGGLEWLPFGTRDE